MTKVDLRQHRPLFGRRKLGAIAFVLSISAALFAPILAQGLWGIGISPVLSDSMTPHMTSGDLVITGQAPAQEVGVGDIIVIRDEQTHATYAHRVLEVENGAQTISLLTGGDANARVDEKIVMVDAEVVLPQVKFVVPYAGAPLVFLGTSNGRLISVGLLITSALLLLTHSMYGRKHRVMERRT
jgi:signal peptidase I